MAVKTRSMIAKSRKLNLKKCRSGAYKKHRKSSVCLGVKRSTVCKRRKGCSYAKGKKRSFCRTRKNKKSRCDTIWWQRQSGGVLPLHERFVHPVDEPYPGRSVFLPESDPAHRLQLLNNFLINYPMDRPWRFNVFAAVRGPLLHPEAPPTMQSIGKSLTQDDVKRLVLQRFENLKIIAEYRRDLEHSGLSQRGGVGGWFSELPADVLNCVRQVRAERAAAARERERDALDRPRGLHRLHSVDPPSPSPSPPPEPEPEPEPSPPALGLERPGLMGRWGDVLRFQQELPPRGQRVLANPFGSRRSRYT